MCVLSVSIAKCEIFQKICNRAATLKSRSGKFHIMKNPANNIFFKWDLFSITLKENKFQSLSLKFTEKVDVVEIHLQLKRWFKRIYKQCTKKYTKHTIERKPSLNYVCLS